MVRRAADERTFCITLLCVQETAFALAKLQQSLTDINRAVNQLLLTSPVGYETPHFHRAVQIAQHLGFKNINDCLHTSLAEAWGCTELLTYNHRDFTRIQPLTSLKITLL